MASQTPEQVANQFRVLYPNFGPRNTRDDAHAITRSELAVSINGWIPSAKTYAKRPGNSIFPYGSTGNTGSQNPITGMGGARFANVTSVIAQSGTQLYSARAVDLMWTPIGTLSANPKPISVAQMYDPFTGVAADTAFIVDGVDIPQRWLGPGHTISPVDTTNLPLNHTGNAPITPRYAATLLSSLWYAGEPTEPTGVYISDPTAPETFTYGGQEVGAAYEPYLIGFNDGVAGGDITGILPLGSSMMVYKESAIYRFDHIGYYGDVGPWYVSLVSPDIGMVSPRSLVNFGTFHAFLSIDGVYTCNGQNISERPISDNNPDLFEGPTAAIVDRTTAVGVRMGSRYLLYYDNGGL